MREREREEGGERQEQSRRERQTDGREACSSREEKQKAC